MSNVTLNQLSLPPQVGTDRPEGRRITIAGEGFGETLNQAIGEVNHEQFNAEAAMRQMVAGQETDIHTVLYAVQRADLSFQLALQVRNKLVQAYDEIMRMQV